MTWKWIGRVGLIFAIAIGGGCGADPTISSGTDTKRTVSFDVPVPTGLADHTVVIRQGTALKAAQLSLDQVLSGIQWPTFLPVDDSKKMADDTDTDPTPLAAQHAYLAGRQAWRERQNFQAIEHLQAAVQLSPKSAAVLKLLGTIYSQSGNKIRGAIYLEKAVSENPLDADSLLLLGRLLGEQGRWTDAVATFAYASRLDSTQRDRVLGKLLQYYLGHALDHEGYDTAAINQLEAYLARPVELDRTTRMLRQIMLLDDQRWATWQTMGDAYNRLGRPADAMLAYRKAIGSDQELSAALVRRLAFTSLRLGRQAGAVQALQQYLQVAGADEVSLSMVHYLSQCGIDGRELAAMLRGVYGKGGRSSSLALTVAGLLDPADAGQFLNTHVRASPDDRSVFEHLVHLELSTKPVDANRVGRVLETTIILIDQLPSATQEYTTILAEATGGKGQSLVDAIDLMPESRRTTAGVRIIKSKVLARTGRVDQAIEELEQVAQGELHWEVARTELARLLVDRGQLDRADELLDTLPTVSDLTTVKLRLAVLHRRGDHAEAIRFLDDLLAKHPPNRVDLVVEKAKLQLVLGDPLGAQTALQQALEDHPRVPQLYEKLIELYQLNQIPDAEKHYANLIRQMLKMIPRERVTRVERAKSALAGGRFEQAELLLRALLVEDPNDLKSLDPLLMLLVSTKRRAEADSAIRDRLEADPTDRGVLTVALRHYRRVDDRSKMVEIARRILIELFQDSPKSFRDIDFLMEILFKNDQQELAQTLLEARLAQESTDRVLLMSAIRHYERIGDKQRVFESTERWLFLNQPSAKRSRDLASLYLNHDRFEQAIEVLQEAMVKPETETRMLVSLLARALVSLDRFDEADEQYKRAIERFPNQGADLKLDWAMHHDRRGDHERSEAILLDLLKTQPAHAAANNALGYAWADRGIHLDRAKEMIRVAMEADGDDAAFLDSMGWVLYKQGQFKEAVVWLQRANAAPGGDYPVILNHLGDALFRVGRSKSAAIMWQKAQRGVEKYDATIDRELVGLDQRLREKNDAVGAGTHPDIADVPGLEPDQPADQPDRPVVVPDVGVTE